MDISLHGLNILILGGDKRELELYFHLKKLGARVFLAGFEKYPDLIKNALVENLREELKLSHVIITPLTGVEANGEIYAPFSSDKIYLINPEIWKSIRPQTLFIAGYLHDSIKKLLRVNGVITCETRELDEISILNAIPTAEGAIQYAMMNTEITIHNSQCFVLGFGRCGNILANTLKALGAEVTVAVRRSDVLAWIEAYKMKPLLLKDLSKEIHRADIIFNTIPDLVMDANVLYHVKSTSLIIEIASHPGGIDLSAAERLKIKTIVLPGLPGKVAPKTAGKILCKVYPSLILSALKGGIKIEP